MPTSTLTGAAKSAKTRRCNKLKANASASMGALVMGGIAPCISYHVAHFQAPDLTAVPLSPSAFLWLVTAGLLVYSAPLIISWFSRYVGWLKAAGFVVGLETAQTFTAWPTALPALAVLVTLNAIILRDKFAND